MFIEFTHAILIVTLGLVFVAVVVIKRIVYRIVVRTTVQQRCVCIQTRTVFIRSGFFSKKLWPLFSAHTHRTVAENKKRIVVYQFSCVAVWLTSTVRRSFVETSGHMCAYRVFWFFTRRIALYVSISLVSAFRTTIRCVCLIVRSASRCKHIHAHIVTKRKRYELVCLSCVSTDNLICVLSFRFIDV